MKKICFVTYETRFSGRLDATAGLALLIASLGRHMPDIPLFIFHTAPCEHLKSFAAKHGPSCTFEQVSGPDFDSWYGKAYVVAKLLKSGFDRVCWLDTDILVQRDCTNLLFSENSKDFITTPEGPRRHANPERHWCIYKDAPKRCLPCEINSCIISATRHHIELIEEFSALCDGRLDVAGKKEKRLFAGGQQFLEVALMHFPPDAFDLKLLRLFVDILHCRAGISLRGGIKLLMRRTPPLLHAIEYKPWWPLDRRHPYITRSLLDCYPYTAEARSFKSELSELDHDMFRDWLTSPTLRSRFCRALPPWTNGSAVFWYFLLRKILPPSTEPPEAELRRALSLLEEQRSDNPA